MAKPPPRKKKAPPKTKNIAIPAAVLKAVKHHAADKGASIGKTAARLLRLGMKHDK